MGDWKYLKFKDREFLFNVATDQHEHINLIDEHPDKAKMLKEKLIEWTSDLKYKGLEMENSPTKQNTYNYYFKD